VSIQSSESWDFAYLVPHAQFEEPIECGPLVLVPPDDARLQHLARSSAAVARLTSRFTDQFGAKMQPSAILIRSSAPQDVDFYAVVSFRNAVAIAAVIKGLTLRFSKATGARPLWSDYFDFYPFTATPDGHLAARSVASTEINRPTKFVGVRHEAADVAVMTGRQPGHNPVCDHWYPTKTCGRRNPTVRSSWNNVTSPDPGGRVSRERTRRLLTPRRSGARVDGMANSGELLINVVNLSKPKALTGLNQKGKWPGAGASSSPAVAVEPSAERQSLNHPWYIRGT
jgi:hypothetical protein